MRNFVTSSDLGIRFRAGIASKQGPGVRRVRSSAREIWILSRDHGNGPIPIGAPSASVLRFFGEPGTVYRCALTSLL
jgi:hypothetical protein